MVINDTLLHKTIKNDKRYFEKTVRQRKKFVGRTSRLEKFIDWANPRFIDWYRRVLSSILASIFGLRLGQFNWRILASEENKKAHARWAGPFIGQGHFDSNSSAERRNDGANELPGIRFGIEVPNNDNPKSK